MVTFQRRYQENTKLLKISKYIADCMIIIVFAYVLVSFTCERTTISGGSMQNVFENGDTVLINRMAYSFHKPKRNSIIAFEISGVKSSKIYVKRVIGLPGETIQIKEGKVFINGSEYADDKIKDYILSAGIAAEEVKLGDDEYFVLGDNRNNSEDSRFANIGTVKGKNIVGSVWMIMNPLNRISIV